MADVSGARAGSGFGVSRVSVPATSTRGRTGLARYAANKEIVIPLGFVALVVFFCFAGPAIFGLPGPNAGSLANRLKPLGTPGHLLGTDANGNDLLSRLLYGGRVSLEVGLGATVLGMVVGGFLGMLAGYASGVADSVIMRILDIVLAFPGLILALAVATYLGPNERDVILALGIVSIPAYARLCRANVRELSGRNFVRASRAMGAGSGHILRRHLPPNVLPALGTYAFVQMGLIILAEAGLSYLGAGVKLPTPTWGNMISQGQDYLSTRPDFVLFPGLLLFALILALNLIANGLRDVSST